LKYFITFIIILLSVLALYVWDASSRYDFTFRCPNPQAVQAFNADTVSDPQDRYQKYFKDARFHFPRTTVSEIRISKNRPFVSAFTRRKLSATAQKKLLTFLNNPDNFNWQKAQMLASESDYILNFYNRQGQTIGKIWLCSSCGKLKAIPFSPQMKFGVIKKEKLTELRAVLSLKN